jgi:NitT/TauT family transport system permease protein
MRTILPPLFVLIVFTLTAEIYMRARHVPSYLLPLPSEVIKTVVHEHHDLGISLRKTAAAALVGFGFSTVIGIVIAVLLSTSRLVQRAFYPYTIFFQTVPIVAVAPLLYIWYGAGLRSVATCAFIVSVFPIIANTLAGLLSIDPALRDLFRLYGGARLATLWKLNLPWALPNIVTGLRISSGLAVIGAIIGEFTASIIEENPPLGIVVITNTKQGNTAMVFAAILAASLLGLLMLTAVNLFGYIVLRHWHASEQTQE